eukprot:gene29782-37144_t
MARYVAAEAMRRMGVGLAAPPTSSWSDSPSPALTLGGGSGSTHRVSEGSGGRSKVTREDSEGTETLTAGGNATVVEADVFQACVVPPRITNLKALKAEGKGSKKKKGRGSPLEDMAEHTATSLLSQGWATVDNFVGLDALHKVHTEIAQLESQYEKGEIWVGKEASVGAQIAVGSVRGDK